VEQLTKSQKQALGAALKGARLRLHWTQEEVAKRGGPDRAYIAHIECGDKVPSLAMLIRCCAAIGVSPCDVLVESRLAAPAADHSS
jgi:transcriptional regulator with XRE-family HTH domain